MIEIVPLSAFDDNYIWLVHDGQFAAAVDPGDADPVLEYLQQHGLKLAAVLITHRHYDHTGGAGALRQLGSVPVFGPRDENIPAVDHPVSDGDNIHIPGLDVTFRVLGVPGHTAGHVAYYGLNSLFCGDTLFGCGCGRLFEGTAEQMHGSLEKLSSLPDETEVYCAHEYTLDNIRFAKVVEPGNPALLERERRNRQAREEDRPTVPSTLAEEKATNPFLRYGQPAVVAAAARHLGRTPVSPAEVFGTIRQWKDQLD